MTNKLSKPEWEKKFDKKWRNWLLSCRITKRYYKILKETIQQTINQEVKKAKLELIESINNLKKN